MLALVFQNLSCWNLIEIFYCSFTNVGQEENSFSLFSIMLQWHSWENWFLRNNQSLTQGYINGMLSEKESQAKVICVPCHFQWIATYLYLHIHLPLSIFFYFKNTLMLLPIDLWMILSGEEQIKLNFIQKWNIIVITIIQPQTRIYCLFHSQDIIRFQVVTFIREEKGYFYKVSYYFT